MNFKNWTKSVAVAGSALIAVGVFAGCTAGAAADSGSAPAPSAAASSRASTQTPSDVLASTAWETTGATDADGAQVALDDENVSNFVGWAYFKNNGTFTMYTLDDEPKMHGDWTVSADGKTRTIVAKDDAGKEQFTRDSDIVTLTADEFTYRVFPDPENTDVYYDIIHTPTDHEEPAV